MLVALLLACRCNPLDPPQDVTFDAHVIQQVGGRFRGQEDTPLDPKVAFQVQASCPTLSKAHVRHANAQIREITVTGAGLERVARVGAALADGTLATAQFEKSGDSLVFPVACEHCEVYFGVRVPGGGPAKYAACIGPGYSLTLEEGQIRL